MYDDGSKGGGNAQQELGDGGTGNWFLVESTASVKVLSCAKAVQDKRSPVNSKIGFNCTDRDD
jgi:hypothetical protein